MIPVYQKEWEDTVDRPGDCLRACVASILELPLRKVPHFIKRRNYRENLNPKWFEDLVVFFEEYGYYAYWGPKWHYYLTGNYSIGYGYIDNRQDWPHTVVCWNGTIIHDPSDEWLLDCIPYYINLEDIK